MVLADAVQSCDLDLSTMTLKSNRRRPVVIRSMCTKFDGSRLIGSICVVFTRFTNNV